jgi:hypothetical protein
MGGQDPIGPVDEEALILDNLDLDNLEEDLLGLDDLADGFHQFNQYGHFEALGEDGLADLALIRALFGKKKRQRRIKYLHKRKNWEEYTEQLITTNEFAERFFV